ncbi:LSU ribosomal protein L10P [Actinopolyspora lacussalsi subsp. righensis]|uniref:Large ribosomal subunit protein uL10 n=2 Tax=Actinopolyspora alba group TaxID=2893675 RepID=A0A1I1WAL4_9ACTN|nr:MULTISPECIES: 50S ribosomal protein L10 [Actinopolyspora alba group]SFD92059.1 LSU ribosomal protein L10P [Actinopolyspora alba]SFT59291.1 LSU ribosomal protein L10P [Actinopolyspora righensis]
MARPEKVDAVNELSENFSNATATVVTEYRGLTTAQLKQLRRNLGEDATYRVAKNTLVRRATQEAGVEGIDDLIQGPTALTFIRGEPVDAAKTLRDFAKDHKALEIKGGYMDGRPISAGEVERIADLDSREVTLGKLAGAMKAKLNETAALFAAPASQVARMTEALKGKKEE